MQLKVVVMAGGRGQRFWPRSRIKQPKQFAPVVSEKSMLEETVARLEGFIPADDIYIATGRDYKTTVQKLLPDIRENNIICEPMARDTAACIYLAVARSGTGDNDIYFFIPADHYINGVDRYIENIKSAAALAAAEKAIIVFGIKPHYPAVNYGYIKTGSSYKKACRVDRFYEKPGRKQAEIFLQEDSFLWNSGMFCFSRSTIYDLYRRYAPQHMELINNYLRLEVSDYSRACEEFAAVPSISFDYAVMEKADSVYCIKADFIWDDVGSWQALKRLAGKGERENILPENSYIYGSQNIICRSDDPEKFFVFNSVQDLNVVLDKNVIYITSSAGEKNIKTILKELGRSNPELL
ncbi:MAG TPA: mannose-1-phosphate guanylyltransferase [Spirochaetota bacterium]|nr:mannose-1-phosphate guanylyltransferase [Spirochaetota bacterium]